MSARIKGRKKHKKKKNQINNNKKKKKKKKKKKGGQNGKMNTIMRTGHLFARGAARSASRPSGTI